MKNSILVVNIIIGIIITVLILVQGKGAGLGSAWGGGGEFYQTRQGIEKIILKVTILAIFFFLIISLISLFTK